MAEKHHKQDGAGFRDFKQSSEQSSENNLDRMFNAALAKYAAVEPRAGLEERVLASVRARRTQVAEHAWWRWGLAALAAVVIVAIGLALKTRKPSQPLVKNPPPTTIPSLKQPEMQVANHELSVTPPRRRQSVRRTVAHPPQPEAVATAYPKLDQFPSPQPLSEQERILASYIDLDPERAALVAEARMEVLRQDHEEERRDISDGSGGEQPRDRKAR